MRGPQVDLMVMPPGEAGTYRIHFTGSKEHNVRLRAMARDRGWSLSEKGFLRIGEDGEPLTGDAAELRTFATEAEAYAFLDLPYIEPELREDAGEIEAALAGRLPVLIEQADLRGDLHSHSDWSDGHHPIEVMADAARRRGYAYQVLTDHSQSLAIARGLTPDRVAEQAEIIAALNARYAAEEAAGTAPPETPAEGFRLLHGCELEVRADGALDFEDDLLARFDLVVASVHVARRQSRAELTRRTLNAIRSPHVDVIAHPSGRKIGQRDDLDLDWDAVYAEAARTGTALEMNGSPPRLDLAVERARRAVAVGCRLSIDSDAHDIKELDFVRWGISQARRAWVDARERRQHPVAGRAAGVDRRERAANVIEARTIGAMDDRATGRDLALVAVTVVGLSRLIDPPLVWLAAGALLGAMLLGTLQVLADEAGPANAVVRRPDRGAHPPLGGGRGLSRRDPAGAVRAVACAGARHHLADRRRARSRSRRGSTGTTTALTADDRTALLVTILLVAFLGFTGVAAMVPGGLVQTGGPLARERPAGAGRGRRARRGAPRLPLGDAAGDARARRRLGGVHLRRGDRDRGRGAARHGDPAAGRAGAPDARVLPVGCVHQHRAVAPPRPELDRSGRAAGRPGRRGRGLEPAAPRLRPRDGGRLSRPERIGPVV